ncbi:MAG: helicase C-terminal domain-containing protein [Candidatus Thorarchaeota archaeon]
MKFCPECDNLLYPKGNLLYCKTCGKRYIKKEKKIKEELKSITSKEKDNKIQIVPNNDIEKNSISSRISSRVNKIKDKELYYLHFFPYEEFRKQQEKIIRIIELKSYDKNIFLLVAPNGTGKTIMALSGLLPLTFKKNLKIIYLCRTHSQNARVIRELNKISNLLEMVNLNLKINGLSIRGRNEMCLNETLLTLKLNPKESMSVCADLRKNRNCRYFLNLLKKRRDLKKPTEIAPELLNKPIDAEELVNFCKVAKFCPYFLSKFLLEEMKVIVCNYQWIFNPFIRDSFLDFIGKEIENCILVIDECHNIIDIATEVNSSRITPYLLRLCLKDLEMYRAPSIMQDFVKFLLDHLNEKKEMLKTNEKPIKPEKLLELIINELRVTDLNGFQLLIKDLQEFSNSIHEERLANGEISRDYCGSVSEFWQKWLDTFPLENYFFSYNIKQTSRGRSISLEIIALDPREITIPILKSVYTCLNLSGTVNPYVYNNLMGLNECGKRYKGIIADSPFENKNIKAIITEGVDTKRKNRTPTMFKKMVRKIGSVISCTPANIGIFCASYKILNGLISNGLEQIVNDNNKRLFVEQPRLSASENALLVQSFKEISKSKGGVLLGVCGGRNSEGEDYPGDFMNAVIIGGFPFHLPTPRVEAKIQYYDKVFNKQGWNLAYLYPAVQRANQASGRPIRKISDKGAIVFMDSRFKARYKWISEWIRKELEVVPDIPNALIENLTRFWNS